MPNSIWPVTTSATGSETNSPSSSAPLPQWTFAADRTEVAFDGFRGSFPPLSNRVYGQINNAVRLAPGDLLFNVHPDNICYQFSPKTGAFTYVFELDWGPGSFLWSVRPDKHGNVFCTVSGMRTAPPIVDADFGNWGAVAVVNPRQHALRTIAERGKVVDPYSVQILDDGRLLVADFAGFSGSGNIYTVDPVSGHIDILAEGPFLTDPTSAFLDGDGILWIANGDQVKQDGEILAVDTKTGDTRTVYSRQGNMSGALLGVFPSHDERYVLATKNEWDQRVHSAVLLIEKATGAAQPILSATQDSPKFFSNVGAVIGNTLWTAECCDRELIEFDLQSLKEIKRHDLRPIMGGHRGMRNSFDAISAVYAVP